MGAGASTHPHLLPLAPSLQAAKVLEAISRRDSGAASEDVPLATTAAAEVAAAAQQEMGHAQP